MYTLNLIPILIAGLLPFATVQAAPADLPETGQTTCSNDTGAATICAVGGASTGQDGAIKAGVAWPNPRFTVGTGATAACVTDNLTGLMWMGAPNGIPDTWANALTSVNNLTLCGFSDWRLPNINELGSLVNSEADNQAIFLNAQGFTGVQAVSYWSSSSFIPSANYAWFVDMSDGLMFAYPKLFIRNYAWPVRAGQ